MPIARHSLLDRLKKHITYPQGLAGCWLWNGFTDNRLGYGYGYINLDHIGLRRSSVHRAMYVVTFGDISSHILVIQTCKNKLCIQPEHLIALTDDYRFYSQVDRSLGPDGCWLWTGRRHDYHGYGRMSYNKKPILTHRLAFLLNGGIIPDGFFVCHHCDNPPCCNPAHLFAGTIQDNIADMMKKGRNAQPCGVYNPRAKLSEQDVLLIRSLKGKETTRSLMQRFGVSESTILYVQKRTTWKHLP